MSNVGRVLVAMTSNAEYIVRVNRVGKIVNFEPGRRKHKYVFRFVTIMGTGEIISTNVQSWHTKGRCEGLTNYRLTSSTKAINATNIQIRLLV